MANFNLNNRWKIIFIAAFLAFLMEYSLRGINGFLKEPAMAILVFANYFTYLALIEDFIGRFRLKDYQVWLVAQFFTLLWQLVSVAGIYYPPFVFGVNIYQLILNNIIWWPTIQTVFALYIGHRLTSNVDRSQPLLTKTGVLGFFVAYVLISASWRLFVTPPVTLWQLTVVTSLIALFAWLSYKTVRQNLEREVKLLPFEADKLLDVLAIFMFVYLTYSFFFLTGGEATTHVINPQALKINLVVSPLIALALLLRRISNKRPITV